MRAHGGHREASADDVRAMARTTRRGGERGAALVEFALVFPLVVMLIVGMATAGQAYNQKLQVTHAVREGARFAATVSPTQAFTNGDTWANNVRDLVVERSAGALSSAQVCVALVEGSPATVHAGSANYSTAGAGTPCIPGQDYPVMAGTDDGLRVQVTAERPGRIMLVVVGDINFAMSARATAKSESGG
jgi:Flp pilus assembly protein TadG